MIQPDRILGAHMPTSGGLYKSLINGKAIGCTGVQLFTANPRQWTHPALTPETIAAFKDAQQQTEIAFTTAHDSYLINLAAPNPEILEKSYHAFRSELDRAQQLGIPWVVTHMGAHLDLGEEEAVARLVASLKRILEETDRAGYTVGIAMETTAGQGTGLGWRFDQIGQILREVGHPSRLGVCLDTCHIFAAGYDLREEASYEMTVSDFDRLIGINNLKVIHANDCLKPLGCKVDRHTHIGEGYIGLDGFMRLVTDPRLGHVPLIVETPDSDTMHKVNMDRLRQMAAGEIPSLLHPTADSTSVSTYVLPASPILASSVAPSPIAASDKTKEEEVPA